MISVIVSIYNVEKYLDRCIKSILNQTYKEFELILVDDGSPDNCPKICDEWEKREKKIRVFHKKNGGLSSARNCGIENAKGDLVIFPDPDDWVEPVYLERLIQIREKNEADLSICGHYYGNTIANEDAVKVVMNQESALERLMLPRSFCGYAWNKLYDLNIIKSNGLKFDVDLGMVQDLHFNVRYFQYCHKVAYDPEPVYHYSIDTGGVTSKYTTLTPRKISGLLTYKKIAEMVHDKFPKTEAIAYSSLCKMCLDDIYVYYKTKMKDKSTLDLLCKEFLKYRKIFYKNDAYDSRDKVGARFVLIHPRMYYYVRRIYWRIFVPSSK